MNKNRKTPKKFWPVLKNTKKLSPVLSWPLLQKKNFWPVLWPVLISAPPCKQKNKFSDFRRNFLKINKKICSPILAEIFLNIFFQDRFYPDVVLWMKKILNFPECLEKILS